MTQAIKQAEQQINDKNFTAAKASLLKLLGNGLETHEIYKLLGVIALETGDYETAITRCQQAIMANMQEASGHFYLGIALEKTNKLDDAIQSYTRAAKLKPDQILPLLNAAKLLILTGRPEQAIPYTVRMCQINPMDKTMWSFYNNNAHSFSKFYDVEKELIQPIEQALTGGIHNSLQSAILRNICFSEWMQDLAQSTNNASYNELIKEFANKTANPEFIHKVQSKLLLTVMERAVIPQIYIELALTQIRKHLLLKMDNDSRQEFKQILLSLWALGFNNEYVFYIEDDEKLALEELKESFNADNPNIIELALLGSYLPLANEEFASKLNNWKPKNSQIAELLQDQIKNPLYERKLIDKISTLSEIQDETTKKVREQYESAPYPRWKELPEYKQVNLKEYISRFGNVAPDKVSLVPTDTKELLVAGSGTGQHPITLATSLPNYNITTVDISLASLAYATRKAEEYKINNLKFMQADILKLKDLNKKFDMIESIGVLHHMKDPMAGWKVLTDILKPGGMMRIGLYSKIAREVITLARNEIENRKLGNSDNTIRKFRRELMKRSYGFQASNESDGTKLTPIIKKLYDANDFFSLSECRDLLFHVQEHQFTLLEIKECISKLGLEFVGLNLSNDPELEAFQETIKQYDADTQLEKWHEYELKNPSTFNGMYQFWLQKPLN